MVTIKEIKYFISYLENVGNTVNKNIRMKGQVFIDLIFSMTSHTNTHTPKPSLHLLYINLTLHILLPAHKNYLLLKSIKTNNRIISTRFPRVQTHAQ